MKTLLIVISTTLLFFISCTNNTLENVDPKEKESADTVHIDSLVESVFGLAETKADIMIALLNEQERLPRSESKDDGLRTIESRDWTSGFFPGELWYIYSKTKNQKWKDQAALFSSYLENQKTNAGTHDMGFKMFCSYGNGYKLTNKKDYKTILIESAYTLSTRFNPEVACIKSWDWGTDRWDFPVIIDNMMNLDLLFWAFQETGDSLFYNISVSHADKTLQHHFREDYSSFHVVDYDPESGEVIKKLSHQGYSNSSAWARGQAWGLYGYTLCYRETEFDRYLEKAEQIADFILNHPNLPEDNIPYWDFDDPDIPNTPRDVSAATVICSALYELSTFSDQNASQYKDMADQIFEMLATEAYSNINNESPFILDHSTGNKPANDEIDGPIIYADYYFVEAALRRLDLN